MISTNWPKTKLGQVCDVFSGYAFKSSGFTENPEDIALVKGENVGQGEILWGISKRWSRQAAEDLAPFRLVPGDVVLAMDRPWVPAGLKYARIQQSAPEALLVQRVARLRARPQLSQNFLPFIIGGSTFSDYVKNTGRGVAVPHISGREIGAFEFALPPMAVQQQIADTLTAYDELMENNRRRMALLEESSRLLYREWFVHLRFPGHEKAKWTNGVPKGWKAGTLRDICTDIRESVSPEELEPETPYIGLEHIPRRSISLIEWGRADAVTSSKSRYKTGDILFGKIRPYFHKVGIAFTDGVASSDAIVIRPHEEKYRALVLMTASSDAFVAEASQSAREGSKMPRADWKLMLKYPVLIPSSGVLRDFSDIVESITAQLKTLCFQTQKLRAARHLLLPRLMNGEIDV